MKYPITLFLFLFSFMKIAHAHWEGNFTLGASVGYVEREGTFELSPYSPSLGVNIISLNRTFEDTGFYAGLVGGYEFRCFPWVIGFDLSLDKQDISKTHKFAFTDSLQNIPMATTSQVAEMRYDRQWILGLSVRTGYEVETFFIPYFRLGIETSDDRLRFNASSIMGERIIVVGDHRNYRWFGGIGAQVPLCSVIKGLAWRLEYNYHHKGHAVNIINNIQAGNEVIIIPASMRPNVHTTFMTFVYDFVI